MKYLMLFAFAVLQNVSFSLVSRSRNRSHRGYHLVASVFSNLAWFATFRFLVTDGMGWDLFAPYLLGTTLGSELGRVAALRIEQRLDAGADHHLRTHTEATSDTRREGRDVEP